MSRNGISRLAATGDRLPSRCGIVSGIVGLALLSASLAGCHDGPAGNATNTAAANASASSSGTADPGNGAADLTHAQGTGGAGSPTDQQRQWLAQATAFMNRPDQQRAVDTALRASAATHPGFCPAATFAARRIDIAFEPAPQFTADGTLMRGTVVYRVTMQGCPMPVLLTVYGDALPGRPLRYRAGLAGTTFADPDLQARAIPEAVDAARPLLPGCTQVAPIDTRLIGPSPSATGTLVPWTEYWLVSGCGRLVSTRLNFTPDRAANQMRVTADRSASQLLHTGAGAAAASPGTASGDGAAGIVVATATGSSPIPLGGAPIPAAKVAGTCLSRLQETAPATAPDHAECLAGLAPGAGAATTCSASRGAARGRMTVAITDVDRAAGSVKFQCTIRTR